MIDLLPALLQEAEFFAHGDGSVAGGYKIASTHPSSNKKAPESVVKKNASVDDAIVTNGGGSTGSRFEGFAVPIGLYLDTSFSGGSQNKYKHVGKTVDRGYMEEDQFGILLRTVTVHKPKGEKGTKKTATKKRNEKTKKKRV